VQAASTKHSEAAAAAATEPVSLVGHLTVLVLQQSSWFQPTHFAASAVALSGLGVSDPAVWDSLTAAAQHKVGAFTFPQLAATLEALAATGYVPLTVLHECAGQFSCAWLHSYTGVKRV
jgi:hypothetical protein